MKFRVIGGAHNHYGVTYKTGDVFESDRDMTKVFRGRKFEKVDDSCQISAGISIRGKEPKKSAASKTPEHEGKEVTKDFQTAIDEEVRVFQSGAWYNVYDGAEEEAFQPLNKKGLRKKDVEGFIKEWADQ